MLQAAALEKEHNGLTVSRLFEQDSDNNQKISKKELEDYIDNLSLNNQKIPEFLQKLQERFDDLDKDSDSELSKNEVMALQYNRGMWTISDTTPSTSILSSDSKTESTQRTSSNNTLSELLKDGAEQAAKYAFEKLKDKVDFKDLISKVF